MKNVIWLVIGVAAGFVVAHEVNKTQQGKQFFTELDTKAREFGEAISEGYRQREAELHAALGDVADAVGDAPAPSAS
ncbi:hypothetical protein E3O45_00075 [Cryobacterium sp. TMS1-20-1]|uniref:Uncharacterized protein n=1 Tax=Cryobacterium levicorallinum TaxID=995038 RepID=A0A1I3A3G1_9MICO|nr:MULTISPECIES: hypothetical protein [Cryobacterium]TFB82692.1 hypothetical protein E3O11_12475 [Cryobacterium levicorallinum]TFC82007.1 hypothetical protein E3O45_00075 [Cryobacterium sp. TMS1-20-1]TFD54341.1 hypothetical protein E3T46_01440 [Cryobacterium sp. Hh11]TFD60786.1 hypothetical protein E3T43_02910 [Cryobacterium sp. Hh7]TFD65981.1 hypothetical protein E3T41_01165 [Cryobacterium sp. Hh38]